MTSYNRTIVACGVSLSNAAHANQSPQSNTAARAVAVRDVSLYRTWVNWYQLIASATALAGWPAVFHTAVSVGLPDWRSALHRDYLTA